MVLVTANLIKTAYNRYEFQAFIAYGPFGFGKSSYALQVLNEVYNLWDYDKFKHPFPIRGGSWDEVIAFLKQKVIFHPKDFVYKCAKERREECIVWDDAGLWLYALEYHNPFVMAVAKYLNVARTDFGAVIFTAPLPTWITRKIRNLPQCITIKIIKVRGNESQRNQRRGIAYRFWIHPDMKHSGIRNIYQDDFSVMLPDPIFNWYDPERRRYAQAAKSMMMTHLREVEQEYSGLLAENQTERR